LIYCFDPPCPTPDYSHISEILVSNYPGSGGEGVFVLGSSSTGAVRFDLGSIPSGATIEQATLRLHLQEGDKDNVRLAVSRSTTSWAEGEGNTPDCTDQTTKNIGLASGYIDINVTDIVRQHHANPSQNYGFCLKLLDTGSRTFTSREGPGSQTPRLEVQYKE
jgi:hypothetical protein